MEVEISTILQQLQTALKAMLEDEFHSRNCAEKMLNVVMNSATFFSDNPRSLSTGLIDQVEQCAADIWNYAVVKKGCIASAVNATLRYVACMLVYKCNNTREDEVSYRKQTMMSLKTVRACLDCAEKELAKTALAVASECVDKLRLMFLISQSSEGDGHELSEKMMDLEKEQLRITLLKAELMLDTENEKESFTLMEQARSILKTLPDEAVTLAVLSHKFGVCCYQRQKFEESVAWLKQSYELGKQSTAVSGKTQASTLRLLAKVYLEWDSEAHWQKALNAIELANSEHSHPVGLHLKLQILLTSGASEIDQIRQSLDEIFSYPDLSLDMAVATLHMLCQYKKNEVALMVLHKLPDKFQDEGQLFRVRIAQLEIHLLSQSSAESVQQLVQSIIKDLRNGMIPQEMINKVQLLLWNQAATALQFERYSDAVSWYDVCCQFFPSHITRDTNLAKLYRNKAHCYISLNQLDKAEEELTLAAQCEPDSAYLYFLKYKLNLLKGQDQGAVECMKKLINAGQSTDVTGLVCLAANLAYKASRMPIAMEALENLITCSTDDQQVLTSLRCLTRMKVTSIVGSTSPLPESSVSNKDGLKENEDESSERMKMKEILRYIKTAYDKLLVIYDVLNRGNKAFNLETEATWFMKIAWNMALMCKQPCEDMCEFFVLCSKLASLCAMDIANLMRQKRCMLMSASISLQLAKSCKTEATRKKYLQDTLLYVQESQMYCSRAEELSLSRYDSCSTVDTTSLGLLLMYEFEARVRLNDGGAERIFERSLTLPYVEAKSFEIMAAICKQSQQYQGLAMKALKVAVKKYSSAERIDFVKYSGAMRCLIDLSLQTGSATDTAGKNEAWSCYRDVIDFIDNRAKETYPEIEIVWLMIKAWNCGIHLYSGGHHQDALHWCEMGISFVKRLTLCRSSYESQMMNAYSELLAKIDSQKASQSQSRISIAL